MLPQQYCLRWKYHHSNLQTMFSQLLDRGCFCDVTLACEGQLIRAHRVVLCACSTFFDTVLTNYASERDPIIIIKDVSYADVKCLIEFMYKGEINVEHTSLASLLKTADDLKIKGLAEVSWRDEETDPMMVADSRLQENIPHNDQKTSSGNHYDGRMSPPLTHIGPNSRVSRLPMLAPMPMASSNVGEYVGPKRKRGRPPLDESYDVFSTPKVTHIPPNCDMMYPEVRAQLNSSPNVDQRHPHRDTEEPIRVSSEPAEWPQPNIEHRTDVPSEGNNSPNPNDTIPSAVAEYYQNNDSQEPPNHTEEITCEEERKYSIDHETNDLIGDDNDHEHDPDQEHDHEQNACKSDDCDPGEASLTTEELAQYGDVVKMDAYLAKGRRPQFWEEPFTRRILDAIKNKKLEMKKAAKVLGVSYGTLYGRYREVYGCLKHPYRVTTTPMSRYEFNWNPKRPGKLKSEGFKRRLAAVKINRFEK